MATGYTEYVGNWRAKATENSYVNNNNGTVTIRITLSVQRKGTGTLNTSTFNIYNGSSKIGGASFSGSGWTSSGQVRTATISVTVSKTAAAHTHSYTNVGFQCVWSGGTSNIYRPDSKTLSWTIPALSKFTITYKANGGTGADVSQTKTENAAVTLYANPFQRTGYAFQRWNTNNSGTGTNYNAGASYTSNAGLTLYAVWKQQYDIRIKENGEWRSGNTTVKVNGEWKTVDVAYIKTGGEWKGI